MRDEPRHFWTNESGPDWCRVVRKWQVWWAGLGLVAPGACVYIQQLEPELGFSRDKVGSAWRTERSYVECPPFTRFSEFGVLHQIIMVIGMILEGLYLRFSHFNAFSKTGHPLDLEGKLI